MAQPLQIQGNYKRKEFKGKSYGRRYAETEFYPPIQSMEKHIRACMFIGKLPIRPVDVDMSRAHPCFVVDLLGDLCPQSIVQYVDITKREGILKKCMQATGLGRKVVKPLYNVPFFADDKWKLDFGEKQNGVVMKEPYRSEFNEYAKGCQYARKLFLEAFPWFMDVAKSTCALKKKGNIEGTAFSYLLQTVEDVVLEDVRLYFLSLQNRKRENLYTLQALIFDGLQLIP
jgi:hypothetical protein